MPDPTTIERLKGLVLSAKDLRELTDWPSALIEDYLNILDNIVTLANLVDVEIDQKIEEIPTDFADGSVPFADSELLVEDNANFFWDIAAELLKLKALILNDATASRLLATDATKKLVSVAALIDHGLLVASGTGGITPLAVATNGQLPIGSVGADPVLATLTGTANQITIANAAGSITLSLPQDIHTEATPEFDEVIANQKGKMTNLGGVAVMLTNKTGANSVAGQLVKADTATDDAVVLAGIGDVECFGVFLDAGIVDGNEAWVVVGGIAEVAFDDNVAAVRGNWIATGAAAGYARTAASPAAAPQHFEEIGHCIESVTAGGGGTHILARCVLHFN